MVRIFAPLFAIRHLTLCLAVAAAIASTGQARAQTVVIVNGDPVTQFDVEQRIKLTELSTHKTPTRNEVIEELIMTREIEAVEGEPSHFVTETILRNVRVLSIDQKIDDKDGEPFVVGQTATLELTPQQAEILTAAQQMTELLTLALRSLADANHNDGKDATHLIGMNAPSGNGGAVTIVRNGVPIEVPGTR